MRRIRPWVVVTGCLLAGVAAVTAVAWHQGGFLRESAANYLRERLAAEFGAQFQTTDLRGTWFPPGLSLGRVTIDRPGEALGAHGGGRQDLLQPLRRAFRARARSAAW